MSKKGKKGSSGCRARVICHHCHERGHIERRCPKRRAEGRRLCRWCGKAHGPRCGMKQAEAKQVAIAAPDTPMQRDGAAEEIDRTLQ